MKRVFDHLRDRLLAQAGLLDHPAPSFTPELLAQIREKKWSKRFEELMRNRIVMGSMRYEKATTAANGFFRNANKTPESFAADARRRIDLYVKTGNTEGLVDLATTCMVEFEDSHHPNAHFQGTDRP